ncbi:MAG: hypothetical protein WCJ84_06645 [Candidatus Peregrinibacteria bacterium]
MKNINWVKCGIVQDENNEDDLENLEERFGDMKLAHQFLQQVFGINGSVLLAMQEGEINLEEREEFMERIESATIKVKKDIQYLLGIYALLSGNFLLNNLQEEISRSINSTMEFSIENPEHALINMIGSGFLYSNTSIGNFIDPSSEVVTQKFPNLHAEYDGKDGVLEYMKNDPIQLEYNAESGTYIVTNGRTRLYACIVYNIDMQDVPLEINRNGKKINSSLAELHKEFLTTETPD